MVSGVNAVDVVYCFSLQSFIEACATGNVGVVRKLLKRGADPNQADEEVRSLTSAVQCILEPPLNVTIIVEPPCTECYSF